MTLRHSAINYDASWNCMLKHKASEEQTCTLTKSRSPPWWDRWLPLGTLPFQFRVKLKHPWFVQNVFIKEEHVSVNVPTRNAFQHMAHPLRADTPLPCLVPRSPPAEHEFEYCAHASRNRNRRNALKQCVPILVWWAESKIFTIIDRAVNPKTGYMEIRKFLTLSKCNLSVWIETHFADTPAKN